jgi:hypothetical protein
MHSRTEGPDQMSQFFVLVNQLQVSPNYEFQYQVACKLSLRTNPPVRTQEHMPAVSMRISHLIEKT